MKKLTVLLVMGLMALGWAQESLEQRSQVLLDSVTGKNVKVGFSDLLERPDMAVLDGQPIAAPELRYWLGRYLQARTVKTITVEQSRSLVSFEEQAQPLVLEWVPLKGGEHYLRGVRAPMPPSASEAAPAPAQRAPVASNPIPAQLPQVLDNIQGMRLPEGFEVGPNGVQLPGGVDVNPDGVFLPGMEINRGGLFMDGVTITPQGISTPGFFLDFNDLRDLSRNGEGLRNLRGLDILRNILR